MNNTTHYMLDDEEEDEFIMPKLKALFFVIDSEGNHRAQGDIEPGDVIEVILIEGEMDKVHTPQVLPESWNCPAKGHYRETITRITNELDKALNYDYEIDYVLAAQLRDEWDAEEDEYTMRAFFNRNKVN